MHLDLVSYLFIAFVVVFSILYKDFLDTQSIGIMIVQSNVIQISLLSFLFNLSSIENNMVSMERCLRYTDIPEEQPNQLANDKELESWPFAGKIRFENYSVKYRPDTEIILKNINFEILPKEKVGVVGRTGSGKSTLCLGLFRLIEPFIGTIYIDDIDITAIGLHKLRSSLTIIPQDPSLVEGSLRYNIDPVDKYTEEEILNVMKMIGFAYIVERSNEGLNQMVTIYV
jgi:ATP-binding cassette subfamily C (CFTR/MRP) protein 1